MVAGDGDRIEIFDLFGDKIFLDIAHHFQGEFDGENAGVLALVFFQNIGLDGAADVGQDHGFDLFVLGIIGPPVVSATKFSTC